MANNETILWNEFYEELSKKLLNYKDKREELFDLTYKVFKDAEINPVNLTNDTDFNQMDPFTFYSIFNILKQDENNKIKLLKSIKKLLNLKSEVPNNFMGIPQLIPNTLRFYNMTGNPTEDVENLWNLFEAALNYSYNQSQKIKEDFINYFNKCLNIKGVAIKKLTMGLFWINPDFYISIDDNNVNLFKHSDLFPKELVEILPANVSRIDGQLYLKFNEKLLDNLKNSSSPVKNIIELSSNAWDKRDEIISSTVDSLGDQDTRPVHYWIFSAGAQSFKWDEFYENGIMALGWGEIGDLNLFESKNEIREAMQNQFDKSLSYKNSAHAAWQFVHEMKPGDVVFVKRGTHKVVGKGIVDSDYKFNPEAEDEFKNIRKVNWTHNGDWEVDEKLAVKTLTDVTNYKSTVNNLNSVFEEESVSNEEAEVDYPEYSKDDFLSQVYLNETQYNTLRNLLKRKKNLILVGPPGTGKTYASKRLAYSIIGEKNLDQVYFIQFHQSYSYEDFIMGFRPDVNNNGFIIRNGPFYEFCKQAEIDSENDYFFIIDEINRGNLSKIFGELFTLLEADKRDTSIDLLYSDEKFSIPKNIHLIGMMNTADRSLALIDYALRRRFAFFEFTPAFEQEGFKEYLSTLESEKFENIIEVIKSLNKTICEDDSLGKGFQIGHSYFCSLDKEENIDEALDNIVNYEIVPLLEEYWFDEPSKVEEWKFRLTEALR